ncbi:MAG: cation transporter dimerization domain-containing protein, partial [Oleibacter sp.]|nr:cation transporter dimerization domain-containing protein [Thalassolituus sp.]
MSDDEEQQIKDIILGTEGVHGFHDLKTRQSGLMQFIQFHLELKGDQSLRKAHDIGDGMEKKIMEKFPKAEVMIHHDPV